MGYRVAEIHPEMVEKMVIVSSGVGCSEDQKWEQLKRMGRNVVDLLLPVDPDGLRLLVDLSVHKFNPCKWAPNFVLQEFVDVGEITIYLNLTLSIARMCARLIHERLNRIVWSVL